MAIDGFAQRLESVPVEREPFPHLAVWPALNVAELERVKAALPSPDGFANKGRGRKLELDIVETGSAFRALPATAQDELISLRDWLRLVAAPILVRRLEPHIRAHYTWLFGEDIAAELLQHGMSTSNGRVMGRGPGYVLEPHLDSLHAAVTCLLYLTDLGAAGDGELCLYAPERQPAVLQAGTYYPDRAEGIASRLVKEIAIRENLFVAFANGHSSLHGLRRPAHSPVEWRFAYQCHVLPRDFDLDALAPRLSPERRARWAKYIEAAY